MGVVRGRGVIERRVFRFLGFFRFSYAFLGLTVLAGGASRSVGVVRTGFYVLFFVLVGGRFFGYYD